MVEFFSFFLRMQKKALLFGYFLNGWAQTNRTETVLSFKKICLREAGFASWPGDDITVSCFIILWGEGYKILQFDTAASSDTNFGVWSQWNSVPGWTLWWLQQGTAALALVEAGRNSTPIPWCEPAGMPCAEPAWRGFAPWGHHVFHCHTISKGLWGSTGNVRWVVFEQGVK